MNAVKIKPGQGLHIRHHQALGIHRVIRVDERRGDVYLYKVTSKALNDKTEEFEHSLVKDSSGRILVSAAKPICMALTELQNLSADNLSEVEFAPKKYAKTTVDQLTKEQKARFLVVKKRIEATWTVIVEEESLERKEYAKTLCDCAKTHGVHRTSIARDMARLAICGLNVHAAAMMTVMNKGLKRKSNRKVTKKLGRQNKKVKKGHDLEAAGSNVTSAGKENLQMFLKTVKDRERKPIAELYRNYIDNYATKPVSTFMDGSLIMGRIPELNMTYGQFNYHLGQIETRLERVIKKVGETKFNLKKRIHLSHAKEGIAFPGHTFVIDSTVLDVYLVNACDRKLLIGRPTVYTVIDAFSQLILSVYVTMEAPSAEQAKVALYQAMTDRSASFSYLGLRACNNGFVQGTVPLFVFFDRGELLSKQTNILAESIQLAQSVAAPYRGDWKSLVERHFGIQNQLLVHWVPGGVRARMKERGDRDTRHDASLTKNDIERVLLNLAAQSNLTKDMSSHVSCTMVQQGIEATPLSFWKYGIRDLHGSAIYLDRLTAIRQFLPALEAKANRQGVHVLENLRFTAPWMREDADYFDLINRTKRAHVYLNPDQPLSAFLLDDSSNDLIECQLVDKRGYAEQDVSIYDIRDLEAYTPLVRSDSDDELEVIKDSLRAERNKIVEDATVKTANAKKTETRSKSRQVKDIKTNRSQELQGNLGLSVGSANVISDNPYEDKQIDAWDLVFNNNDLGDSHGSI